MMRLERIGQQAAIAAGVLALVAIGFFVRDALGSKQSCGQTIDTPCWQVHVAYSDMQERLIVRLNAAGFTNKEITDYLSGASAPLPKSP